MSRNSSAMLGCLKGCGIVAGLGLIVMIAAGIGGYFFFRGDFEKLNTEGKAEMVFALKEEVQIWRKENKVPPANEAVVNEFITLIEGPEVSFASVALSGVVLQSVFDDGKVTNTEDELLAEALDFIRQQPNAGLLETGRFLKRHPGIQGATWRRSVRIRRMSERMGEERRETTESGTPDKSEESPVPALEKEEASAPNAG